MPKQLVALGMMTGIRLFSAFAVYKGLSLLFGPQEFGILAHVIGTAAIFYSFSGTTLVNGLTAVTAAEVDARTRRKWLTAGATISLVTSILIAAVAIALYWLRARLAFDQTAFAHVLLPVAGAQFVVGQGNVALAFLISSGEVGAFILANSVGSVVSASMIIVTAMLTGFAGALYAASILPLAPSAIALGLLWSGRRSHMPLWGGFEWKRVLLLLRHSGASLIAISALPIAQFLLRTDIAERFGWEAVGQWQSVARLSDGYMQAFAVLLVNYLLPTISRLPDESARRKEFWRISAITLSLFLLGATIFALARKPIIEVAYSAAFLSATVFVLPQVVGDAAKLIFLLAVYYSIANGRVWTLGITELCYSILLLGGYHLIVAKYGVLAVVYALVIAATAVAAIT
jgi:PST family polysaccharide transporter